MAKEEKEQEVLPNIRIYDLCEFCCYSLCFFVSLHIYVKCVHRVCVMSTNFSSGCLNEKYS